MNKINPIIKEYGKPYSKDISKAHKKIKDFQRIAIFRHITPDFDALGTQLGIATWIKDNFPEKEVICLGDNHVNLTPRVFPKMDRVTDKWFDEPFLAIVVDTANKKRVADPRAFKTRNRIWVDHHPSEEKNSAISIINRKFSAASEVCLNMILNFRGDYTLSKEAARYFYIALVGDNGRFRYKSTSVHTFEIAQILLEAGINISTIYGEMYLRDISELKIDSYILNHYSVSEKGVAYYVLDDEALKELGITVEQGKENVNVFSDIIGIPIWLSVTQDIKEGLWRVSIRSSEYVINEVAKKWRGGGHAQASGAKLKSLNELPLLVKDLEDLIV